MFYIQRVGAIFAVFSALALGTISSASAQSYIITDLNGEFLSSRAFGINASGQVVGISNTNGELSATLWSGGTSVVLAHLPGFKTSVASDINNQGKIVGWSLGGDGTREAALWDNGAVVDLGPGHANAINNRGQIVGRGPDPDKVVMGTAQMWRRGTTTVVFSPGSNISAINDLGQVAGSHFFGVALGFTAAIWAKGELTDLGALFYPSPSSAFAINNAGQVVGSSVFCGDCNDRATLWSGGEIIDLGTLGGRDSIAWGINNRGQIVGTSKINTNDYRATIWCGTTAVDLNTLVHNKETRLILTEAKAINGRGQIVGDGQNIDTGRLHAFLATPVRRAEIAPLSGIDGTELKACIAGSVREG